MNSWYTVKIKYIKELEDGRLKSVSEPYLVDSVSFTDAEARMYEEVGSQVRGEFLITGITKTDYADIFYYEDCDEWYKCKVTYETMDADSGKSKNVSNNYLVTAASVHQAYERIKESLSDMLVTIEIPSIALSPIVEVLPYVPSNDVELDRRPATDEELATGVPASAPKMDESFDEDELEDEESVSSFEDETEEE